MDALVWFRNDLRLVDNPALKNAFENSKRYMQYLFFQTNNSKSIMKPTLKYIS